MSFLISLLATPLEMEHWTVNEDRRMCEWVRGFKGAKVIAAPTGGEVAVSGGVGNKSVLRVHSPRILFQEIQPSPPCDPGWLLFKPYS